MMQGRRHWRPPHGKASHGLRRQPEGVARFNGCRQCRRPPLMSTCEYRCQHMRAMPRAWTSGSWFRVQGLVFRGLVLVDDDLARG